MIPELIGTSEAMQRLKDFIAKAAPTEGTVLIQGESGTGKELVAGAIHRLSNRSEGPFVAINCAAIPDHLLESELFGHKKGAFTGAASDQPGKFQQAEGGTLFLDEIGELSAPMQAKLLRVIQERVVDPLGGRQSIPIDIRLVAVPVPNP